MIGRGLFVVTILSSCVLSLPLTPSQLENEDAEVMKCIVEALADVLSRPHPMPVSQECLTTLKTDDRLVSILRHHNFLKELQEIAVQGGQGKTQLHGDAGTPDPTTPAPQTSGYVADRSMLEALGGPGERSILSQKRRTGNGEGGEEKDESPGGGETQEDNEITEEVEAKRESDERPGGHISAEEGSEGKAEKREEEQEEYEEKRVNSEEDSEEEHMIKDKKGAGSEAPRHKPKEKKFDGESDEGKDKRSALSSHKHKQEQEEEEEEEEEEEDEGDMKRGSKEGIKRWARRSKAAQMRKKSAGGEAQRGGGQQEVPHHSKEVTEGEEVEEATKRSTQRSPEERELQMIARRGPEERRVSEEEGSASRKSEEPEIESLAAIESELENVAQKLHELRRG